MKNQIIPILLLVSFLLLAQPAQAATFGYDSLPWFRLYNDGVRSLDLGASWSVEPTRTTQDTNYNSTTHHSSTANLMFRLQNIFIRRNELSLSSGLQLSYYDYNSSYTSTPKPSSPVPPPPYYSNEDFILQVLTFSLLLSADYQFSANASLYSLIRLIDISQRRDYHRTIDTTGSSDSSDDRFISWQLFGSPSLFSGVRISF